MVEIQHHKTVEIPAYVNNLAQRYPLAPCRNPAAGLIQIRVSDAAIGIAFEGFNQRLDMMRIVQIVVVEIRDIFTPRLRNRLVPQSEGGVTKHIPSGEVMSIFDASVKYEKEGVPLIVLAGKEYGSGSSRDWAAKGPLLLGVRAVIARSYERIHRSNLVGMGILPLEFLEEEDPETLGLIGEELYDIIGLRELLDRKLAGARTVKVQAKKHDGTAIEFDAKVRIDTPQEILYYQHGGILHYVLRQLLTAPKKASVA